MDGMLTKLTKQYCLSKTLRFELIPQGETAENIKKHGIISHVEPTGLSGRDAELAEKYKTVKLLLDGMHRCFLNDALAIKEGTTYAGENGKLRNAWQDLRDEQAEYLASGGKEVSSPILLTLFDDAMGRWLEQYKADMPGFWKADIARLEKEKVKNPQKGTYYSKSIKKLEAKIKKGGEKMNASASLLYKNTEPPFQLLEWVARKGWIDDVLREVFQAKDAPIEELRAKAVREIIRAFDGFNTYISGFNQNRANVYAMKNAKFTSVLHRLYAENLQAFAANAELFSAIMERVKKAKEAGAGRLPLDEASGVFTTAGLAADGSAILDVGSFVGFMSQSRIDAYNELIGGIAVAPGKEHTRGINQLIKETRDVLKGTGRDFPMLRHLYKLPLSLTESTYRPKVYGSDVEVLTDLAEMVDKGKTDIPNDVAAIKGLLSALIPEDFSQLTLDEKQARQLSAELFGGRNWHTLQDRNTEQPKEKSVPKDSMTWARADALIHSLGYDNTDLDPAYKATAGRTVAFYMEKKLEGAAAELEASAMELEKDGFRKWDNLGKQQSEDALSRVSIMKRYLDARNAFAGFIKRAAIENRKALPDIAVRFNAVLASTSSTLDVFERYNKVRNYVTRKPFSADKSRLNFDNSQFLGGWDQNEESVKSGVLFEKDGAYFLGVLCVPNDGNNGTNGKKAFAYFEEKDNSPKSVANKAALRKAANKAALRKEVLAVPGEACYRKMIYKVIPQSVKMLPKVAFSRKGQDFFKPSAELLRIKEGKLDKTSASARAKLIDFYREVMVKYPKWACYHFTRDTFKPGSEYADMKEFFEEVDEKGYLLNFENVKCSYVDELVRSGKMYLFQIYNKDFSAAKKAGPNAHDNLHTMYWKALFSEENAERHFIKLLGGAQVFFRPWSIAYSDEKRKTGHHAEDLKGRFSYPILKDRRYSLDKFFFHCPLALNPTAAGLPKSPKPLNEKVNGLIKAAGGCNVIGIDRGERNLLYYSVVSPSGTILESGSLNTVTNGFIPRGETEERVIDYHEKLDTVEAKRRQARLDWTAIEKIKDLKEGYLSQIVYKLARLVLKYNAVIVLENLNIGFKRGRFGIEKQVYQKFEVALMSKLAFLVLKDARPGETGAIDNAFQFSLPAASLEKISQNGIIYYIPAAYTSRTDPVTGWMRDVYQTYGSVVTAQGFWRSFDSIVFNPAKDRFEFTYRSGKIRSQYRDQDPEGDDSQTTTVCSCVARAFAPDAQGGNTPRGLYSVTDEMKKCLTSAGIAPWAERTDIRAFLADCDSAPIQRRMMQLFNAMLNMRVEDRTRSAGTKEADFIQSPVEPFFDSRKGFPDLPDNGDANGAYNIARKGLCLIRKIVAGDTDHLSPSSKEWRAYAQSPQTVKAQIAKMK